MTGAQPDESLTAARPGTVLGGKYRVERELARGGMGIVVIATHLKLDRPVAIKLLSLEGKDRAYVGARFLREARAAARLTGEHVVRIIDLDETPNGTPYLVMEFLDGVDLEFALKAEGPLAPARAVDLVLQACAALAEAHARGVVHRDVKPSNLLRVTRVDGVELIKLVDFGISKMVDDEVQLTRTATALGSPLFMSPEQLLSPKVVDPRSDLWSLGVTLYRLLSEKAPFDAADASSLAAQIAARPPTPLAEVAPGLPPALCAVVMRCLEKDPALRWPNVVALADALEPFRAPPGLGSAASVRLAEAQAKANAAAPPETEPAVAAPGVRDGWTLSHDVPMTTPEPQAGSPLPLVAVPLTPVAFVDAPPKRATLVTGAVIAVAAVFALGAWFASLSVKSVEAPAVMSQPRSARVAVTGPTVVPPAVAVAVDPGPAARPDAGAVGRSRPAKPAPGQEKDPSVLELK